MAATGRTPERLSQILDSAGVKPPFPVLRVDGGPANDVETHIFSNGELTIVALQRDYLPSVKPEQPRNCGSGLAADVQRL